MTYTFNNTNIITGYIKEMLKDFNLPTCPVYKENSPDGVYIDENFMVLVKDGIKTNIREYSFGDKLENNSKNLILKSKYYDTYTHEYLGDFLRFIRDFKKLNLMPLYNCFSQKVLEDFNHTFNIISKTKTTKFVVNSSDADFIYYSVPVKFDQTYTIAIESNLPYELGTMVYTGQSVSSLSAEMVSLTYKKVTNSQRKLPILYSVGHPETNKNYFPFESCLKLIIKLPSKLRTAITVLEGNYVQNASMTSGIKTGEFLYNQDYEEEIFSPQNVDSPITWMTKLSLLEVGTETSYPFSDRLVEYLTHNVITFLNTIPYNIGRIQNKVYISDQNSGDKTYKGLYDYFDHNLKRRLFEVSQYTNYKTSDGHTHKISSQGKLIYPVYVKHFVVIPILPGSGTIYDLGYYYNLLSTDQSKPDKLTLKEIGVSYGSRGQFITAGMLSNIYYNEPEYKDILITDDGVNEYYPAIITDITKIIDGNTSYGVILTKDLEEGNILDTDPTWTISGTERIYPRTLKNNWVINSVLDTGKKIRLKKNKTGIKVYSPVDDIMNWPTLKQSEVKIDYPNLKLTDLKSDILFNVDKDMEGLVNSL